MKGGGTSPASPLNKLEAWPGSGDSFRSGRHGDGQEWGTAGSGNVGLDLVLETWLLKLSSSCCCQGDGGGGGRGRRSQSFRLGRASSTAASLLKSRRSPLMDEGALVLASLLQDHMAEGRPTNLFLPARRWHQGRQCYFIMAFALSSSSRLWRRRCGGVATPSGEVPGGGGVESVLELQQGPDRVLSFPYRVLHVKSRDWTDRKSVV